MGLSFWRWKSTTSTHTEIRKVNFLIHPGFIGDMRFFKREEGDERLGAARTMFAKYKARAESLGPDEVLVAFSHHCKSELRALLRSEDAYSRLMTDDWKELRDILGKRLVVMSFDQDIFDDESEKPNNPKNTVCLVKRIMLARGLHIHDKAQVFAFGETFGTCVADAAMALNLAGQFRKNTHIIAALCDVGIFGGMDSSELHEFIKNEAWRWTGVRFDCTLD